MVMKSAGSSTPRIIRVILLSFALTGTVFLQVALSQTKPAARPQPKPIVLDEKQKAFGPEANPQEVFKETRGKSALRSHGVESKKLAGKEAGKPISSMRGAKTISRRELTAMKQIPKTGLYLLDLDHVPPGLEEDLKKNGYQLAENGTLTQNGKPVALFIYGETYHIGPAKAANWYDKTLTRIARAGDQAFGNEAQAATPFPWACWSWYWKWQYDGGFCRDYKVWTDAYAWGPGPGGTCSDPKPLTHIDYISTYAAVGGHTGWDYHYGADQSHAYAEWDIGCFWPAFGTPSGFHYAYWRDGSNWVYRTYSW
jgi:hypothetical protein